MRSELEQYKDQEVGVEFVVEKKGHAAHGVVRCVKYVKVLVVREHKLVQVAEVHHMWVQHPPQVVIDAREGQVVRAVGVVREYVKSGGVRDYTVQEMRSARVV